MKIYRVVPDVNNFQYLMLKDQTLEGTERMRFDGGNKRNDWIAPEVFIYKPKKKKGDFMDLWSTTSLAFGEKVRSQLLDLLEMSGEILPLDGGTMRYHLINVTECVDALDRERTKWKYEKGSVPITDYHFHEDLIPESPLFKIPETCKMEILTVEGMKDPEDEFKFRVESGGLTGLLFEELWDSEKK